MLNISEIIKDTVFLRKATKFVFFNDEFNGLYCFAKQLFV